MAGRTATHRPAASRARLNHHALDEPTLDKRDHGRHPVLHALGHRVCSRLLRQSTRLRWQLPQLLRLLRFRPSLLGQRRPRALQLLDVLRGQRSLLPCFAVAATPSAACGALATGPSTPAHPATVPTVATTFIAAAASHTAAAPAAVQLRQPGTLRRRLPEFLRLPRLRPRPSLQLPRLLRLSLRLLPRASSVAAAIASGAGPGAAADRLLHGRRCRLRGRRLHHGQRPHVPGVGA